MNNPYASPAPAVPYGAASGDNYRPAGDGVAVTEMTVEMLRQTKPWVTFLGVMSFIGSGLMLLGGVAMIALGALVPRGASPVPTAMLGAIYIPLAFIYIYPGLKLWGFSGAIGRLVASRSSMDLEAALAQQKSFWKFVGLLTVIMMALYALVIVGAVVVGIGAAARH